MSDINLKECISKLHNGDKEAFTLIYNELKQPVFTIACRIVKTREVAEDITQDVFVKLFASPPDLSVKNPRAWIFKMTHNCAVDILRKKRTVEVDDTQIAIEDSTNNTILKLDIESAIAQLSDCEREVLALHINGGLNFNDTAKIVGLSLPATYRKYRKALKTLRGLLDGGEL